MAENADSAESRWRELLTLGEIDDERRDRRILSRLPGHPRCRFCHAPFKGLGSPIARWFFSRRPSNLNPNFCSICEDFTKSFMGGVEIKLTALFVDVRGSTGLAESLSPTEFASHMNHFFATASDILIKSDAFIDKFVGDEVIALFVPGFAGPEYSRVAVDASANLLTALSCDGPQGRSFSVGVGVHTGLAFMGAVGTKDGRSEITALGDVMNVAARLASAAGPGEALVSDATIEAAELDASVFERRDLRLKGREEGVRVCILR